eukprot:CAMPEP_0167760646 /NCGR_PEP_ID=MMETSP0110_2-20121227/11701_1 /TAXON_ID=629695 /ORGANISM="Gymnochlora sp., Strain CCMP2014" /LENGTH=364 /DNA_ID=CAMNT_0007647179 /DNA_START=381 /DNA_END=1472 /DNA_ORIENTATION=-
MVLNSLAIDPGRIWKGGWRWFSEEMLDCCESLDRIRKQGISFDKLACLASCNGASVDTWRALGKESDEEHFRAAVKDVVQKSDRFMIVSYARSVLGQTGEGHFSPIAAYHEKSDRVLIMDTARFKYPPHWVPIRLLVKAMQKPSCEKSSRGYMTLTRSSGDGSPTSSVLFVLTLRQGFDESALRNIRRFFQSVKSEKQRKMPFGDDAKVPSCKICSRDGREMNVYVSCFLSAVPAELLNAVTTVVNEFRVGSEDFGEISVRPKYQEIVNELLRDIRDLPVYAHVARAAKDHSKRLEGILEASHGLELLTVLLLAAPVKDLSECGRRVNLVMRESEDNASEIVRNEIKALRNQLWIVFNPREKMS